MLLLKIDKVQEKLLELMKKVHIFLVDNNIPYYMLGGSALGAIRHNGFIPWDDDIDIGMLRADYEKFLSVCHTFDSNYEVVNFSNNNNCDNCLTRIYLKNTYICEPSIQKTKLDKRLYFDIFPIDNVPDDSAERDSYEKKIKAKKILIARIDARNNNDTKLRFFVKRLVSLILKPFRNSILQQTDSLMRKYSDIYTKYVCSLSSQYSFAKQVMPRDVYGIPKLHTFADSEFYVPEKTDEYLTILFGSDYMQIPPENKRRKPHDIYCIEGK